MVLKSEFESKAKHLVLISLSFLWSQKIVVPLLSVQSELVFSLNIICVSRPFSSCQQINGWLAQFFYSCLKLCFTLVYTGDSVMRNIRDKKSWKTVICVQADMFQQHGQEWKDCGGLLGVLCCCVVLVWGCYFFFNFKHNLETDECLTSWDQTYVSVK